MKKVVVLVSTLVFFASCSSPLDKKYSKETFKKDLEEIAKDKSLDSSSKRILAIVALANAFNNDKNIEGKTYKEIIEQVKAKELEEKALAEKARAEEALRIEKLSKALNVAVFEKGFYAADYQDYISYKLIYENKSSKKIRAFKGEIKFFDLFGEEIYSLGITHDQPINIGENTKDELLSKYNQFIDSHKLFASKELNDLKITWIPEKIIFEDGSTLE